MSKFVWLKHRCVFEISGQDRHSFLQGLITNDVNKVKDNQLIYSAMLNSQGRFLYDFFLFEKEEKIFVDCFSEKQEEIIKKLNFYKLRSKVEIKKNEEIHVIQNLAENIDIFLENKFIDPRFNQLSSRIYATQEEFKLIKKDLLSEEEYHFIRIKNKICEGEIDLTFEKSFILEFGFNQLNAVDYNKGCYIGQEPTARTHHLGEIRKKIFHITFDRNLNPEKNSEIYCEEKSVGVVLSSCIYDEQTHALAIIKISNDFKPNNLSVGQSRIIIVD
jgi:hypothetical protein